MGAKPKHHRDALVVGAQVSLREIKFCRNQGKLNEWRIEGKPQHGEFGQWLAFAGLTLIVGKNASGKSKTLIELIIGKVQGSAVQVIMTANDRFVMNKVPLAYWSVMQRVGNKSIFFNRINLRQTFDEFAYAGLSNFDFLKTEFYRSAYKKEDG